MGYEHDMKTKPDILVLAKSISGGVTPVSGIVANDEVMMTVKPGDHGSTYGGNPLGMAVAKRAVEVLHEDGMIENSRVLGDYLHSLNKGLKSDLIKDVRGRGLFQGIEFRHDLKVNGNHFAKLLFKRGMITKATHDYCIRLSPALVITKAEIDEAHELIKDALQELETMA